MDAPTEARWREGLKPFDGGILLSPYLRVDDLRTELSGVVAMLPPAAELSTFLDWHEHDGYVTGADSETWDSLQDAVSDRARFVRWSSDDTFVRRAWYPPNFAFLLRWCLSSDPDDFGLPPGEPAGRFDVSASHDVLKKLTPAVTGAEIRGAKEYFDEAWAG